MRAVIEPYQGDPRLEIVDDADHWLIRIPREGGFIVEVFLSHDVLEWSLDVRRPGGTMVGVTWGASYELKSDEEPTGAEAFDHMADDVRWLLERLLVSSLRLVTVRSRLGLRRERLEWRTADEDWEPVWPPNDRASSHVT